MATVIGALALAGSLIFSSHGGWTPHAQPTRPATHAVVTSTPLEPGSPYTGGFVDVEANFNGEPITSIPNLNPTTFKGRQAQSNDLIVSGSKPTTITLTMVPNTGTNWSLDYHDYNVPLTLGQHTYQTQQLSVNPGDSSCGWGPASIDVLDISFTNGQLTSFAATVEAHCPLEYGASTNPEGLLP